MHNNNQKKYIKMKNFKLSQDAKEFIEGAIYFVVAFTGSLLIASTFFNK